MLAKLSDNFGIITPWKRVNHLSKDVFGLLDDLGEHLKIYSNLDFPDVDLTVKDNAYVAEFAIPGFKQDEIDVEVVGDFLTVSAQRASEELKDDERYIFRSRPYGKYEESIKLPGRVKPTEVTAKYVNGILTVTLPKQEVEQPTSIKVNL